MLHRLGVDEQHFVYGPGPRLRDPTGRDGDAVRTLRIGVLQRLPNDPDLRQPGPGEEGMSEHRQRATNFASSMSPAISPTLTAPGGSTHPAQSA
jgi:hypothetical protein